MVKLYNLTNRTCYKLKNIKQKDMTKEFKSDAFLYLAFAMLGMTAIAQSFIEKILCIVGAVLILVIRSFVKKYLNK